MGKVHNQALDDAVADTQGLPDDLTATLFILMDRAKQFVEASNLPADCDRSLDLTSIGRALTESGNAEIDGMFDKRQRKA